MTKKVDASLKIKPQLGSLLASPSKDNQPKQQLLETLKQNLHVLSGIMIKTKQDQLKALKNIDKQDEYINKQYKVILSSSQSPKERKYQLSPSKYSEKEIIQKKKLSEKQNKFPMHQYGEAMKKMNILQSPHIGRNFSGYYHNSSKTNPQQSIDTRSMGDESSPVRKNNADGQNSPMIVASPKHIYLKLEQFKNESERINSANKKDCNQSTERSPQKANQGGKTLIIESKQKIQVNPNNELNTLQNKSTEYKGIQNKPRKQSLLSHDNVNTIQNGAVNIIGEGKMKGSQYQNESSLELIRRMMEQKDFKKLEMPKQQDYEKDVLQRLSNQEEESPEKMRKKVFKDQQSSGDQYMSPNQDNRDEQQETPHLGSEEISWREVTGCRQSISQQSKSKSSGCIKTRISQESLLKSLEERKRHTFATNNQKCIIFTKDTSTQKQQNNGSFSSQTPIYTHHSTNSRSGIMPTSSTIFYPTHDEYFVQGTHDNFVPRDYLNQQDQVRQSQILQLEDEEAILHQRFLQSQDAMENLENNQSDGKTNNHVPFAQVMQPNRGNPQEQFIQTSFWPESHEIDSYQRLSDQSQISGVGGNHMTFGYGCSNELRKQMSAPSQEVYSTSSHMVSVNQILKQSQQLNLESYHVSNMQSPDKPPSLGSAGEIGGGSGVPSSSIYNCVTPLSPQSASASQKRVRAGSSNANNIKLNASSESTLSKSSSKQHGIVADSVGTRVHLCPSSRNFTTHNRSYVSSCTTSTSQRQEERVYTSADERTPNNNMADQQAINKKDLNWLDYSSFERNKLWLKLKQQNRNTLQKELSEKEHVLCTFKPSLIASTQTSLKKKCVESRVYNTTPSYQPNKCSNASGYFQNMTNGYSINPSSYHANKHSSENIYQNHNSNPSKQQKQLNSHAYFQRKQTTQESINEHQQDSSNMQRGFFINSPYNHQHNGSYQNSTYQIGAPTRAGSNSNNVTVISTLKNSFLQNNISPPSYHQEIKKANKSYAQINKFKKNVASSPNILNNPSHVVSHKAFVSHKPAHLQVFNVHKLY